MSAAAPWIGSPNLSLPRQTAGHATATDKWHFRLATGLLGFLFFMTTHDVYVSQLPDYAHYDDSVISVAVGTNIIRRIAFFLLAGLGAYFTFFSAHAPWRCNPWIILPVAGYVVWCCASVFWSAEPSLGLKRVITLLCFYVCALGMGRRFTLRDLCWMTLVIMGTYLAMGLLVELALGTFRPWQAGHRFAGTLHPNSQGAHLSLLCLAAFSLATGEWKSRRWLYALVGVGLVFIVLTRSRTNLLGVVLALAVIGAFRSSLKTRLVAAYGIAFAGCCGLMLLMLCGKDPLSEVLEAAMLGREDDIASLSGRGFIWPLCWEFIGQHPWLGYGYGSFWTPERIELFLDEIHFSIFEAHNSYLELRLGTGLVGCILFVAGMTTALIASAWATMKSPASGAALLFGIMVFTFVYANNESGMVGINLVTLLMTALTLNLALRPLETTDKQLEGAARVSIA